MRKKLLSREAFSAVCKSPRRKIRPPPPASTPVIRVTNNIVHLGRPKHAPKPRQLLSLPPFPGHPLLGKNSTSTSYVTAISWLRYYFNEIPPGIIQKHFNEGLLKEFAVDFEIRKAIASWKSLYLVQYCASYSSLLSTVQIECLNKRGDLSGCYEGQAVSMRKIRPNDVMEVGARVHVPVSVPESKISKRFDVIPSATLYPNADEIEYLQRLVKYKDSAILVLNKPPNLPVKGSVSIHNSLDALAAASLSYGYDEGPKLVCRLDRESSGLLLMGRTKESISYLQWLYIDTKKKNSFSKDWNEACDATYQRYWALVIGSPKQKEGLIRAPLTKVLLNDGKTERVILAHNSGLEASQEAITEYRVLGPTINGCSWIELRPHTSRKHQLRVHCAEALGTPIVGDYKYGWFVHNRWKQLPRVDYEATTGEAYRMKRPAGLDVQKGSVLSKVPLLHLHCREMVLPNIAKFIDPSTTNLEQDLLRFVTSMPSHMKISWNLMCSYLV